MRDYQDYLIKKLKDPDEAEAYLNASLEAYMEDNDTKALMLALEHLARAKYSVTELSRITGVSRQHVYRIFDNESNPNFTTISTIIKSLGFTLGAKRTQLA
ncbi:MAG: putative addiction module antidote protein [Candidatus Gastranaerophilales bacterium]|nr:putative addiction module antidote protein [Candidatus Gastranaerophilales bacterium]